MIWGFCVYFVYMIPLETDVLRKHRFQKNSRTRVVCIKDIWFPATYTGCNGIGSVLGSNIERGFDDMGILCVFCVYDTIGNRCFEKTSFPKKHLSQVAI